MAGRSALTWSPVTGTDAYAGHLSCRHGETVGAYTPGAIPGTPGQAARRMLQAHQAAYGCECTRQWWTYYQPGGAGWLATDAAEGAAAAEAAVPTDDAPPAAPRPRWRYQHLVAGADTDRTEKELERLSATGWEVVTLAIVPGRLERDSAEFVYLLRTPVPDHDGRGSPESTDGADQV
jgi:hypothetical protein